MRMLGLIWGIILVSLIACGPNVPAAAVQGSGIITSYREGNQAIILYRKASTTDGALQAEAQSMCGKINKRPGRKDVAAPASTIPGVDSKVIFACV